MHQKSRSYDVWLLRYKVQRAKFFVILIFFALWPFYNNPKNQNFEKLKKTLEIIIILQKYTINDNHMIYGSWDTNCNRQIFFFCHLRPFFPHFNPLTAQKLKSSKNKKKKTWRYHHFPQVYQKSWSYVTLFLRYGTWRM